MERVALYRSAGPELIGHRIRTGRTVEEEIVVDKQPTAAAPKGAAPNLDAFERELTELGENLRRDISQADFRHLRKIERAGRLCGLCLLWLLWLLWLV